MIKDQRSVVRKVIDWISEYKVSADDCTNPCSHILKDVKFEYFKILRKVNSAIIGAFQLSEISLQSSVVSVVIVFTDTIQ